ncbi:hypothetical protein N781_10150 [Pontibacillus halophilus JSM 076056 = DSM 19796]|uniref:dUTPase n=1 Tax=Pontibacillus halophilus JSM 076056 = DSM 19796 TaxID=1385510 RepID=A0A0A5IC39_9BACI|nr:dUTP diphosphatase [Pontibacillus halophilus]KGX93407.1 hypothetical protein N781_10150 [Pontibacillus halophilus JSM 076056 = DSM 19796]
MNWNELYQMQQELDTYIEQKHELTHKDLFQKKVMALLVEVGELANETRCFKFWSQKAPSPDETILEEYVDGIHFILSLGLEKGYTFNGGVNEEEPYGDLTDSFHEVYRAILSFKEFEGEREYEVLFRRYLQVGNRLGFSEDALIQAYKDKNKVNHTRQDQDY